jgi:hypothetical protein
MHTWCTVAHLRICAFAHASDSTSPSDPPSSPTLHSPPQNALQLLPPHPLHPGSLHEHPQALFPIRPTRRHGLCERRRGLLFFTLSFPLLVIFRRQPQDFRYIQQRGPWRLDARIGGCGRRLQHAYGRMNPVGDLGIECLSSRSGELGPAGVDRPLLDVV